MDDASKKDREIARLRNEVDRLCELVAGVGGHDEPCYYCGKPCDSLAGNPSKWPIPLCHTDAPGVVKWHHTGCVTERLIENQPR